MTSVIAQINGRRVMVLEELFLPDTTTQEACDEFVKRSEKYRQARIYGDATGRGRQHAGVSDWQIVERTMSGTSDRIRYERCWRESNPEKKDRIAAVNAKLRNAAGEVLTEIHPSCTLLTEGLEQVMYKSDSNRNQLEGFDTSNPLLTHISEAFGYMIDEEFGVRPIGGERNENLAL